MREALSALRAAVDGVADCEVDLLGRAELVEALDELEAVWCQVPAVRHRIRSPQADTPGAASVGNAAPTCAHVHPGGHPPYRVEAVPAAKGS